MDYQELANAIETAREALRAMVAALVIDGFNEEQAREIVTAIMKQNGKADEEEEKP